MNSAHHGFERQKRRVQVSPPALGVDCKFVWMNELRLIQGLDQLHQGAVLELADPFAGQTEVLADFTEGQWRVRLQAESHTDDRGLSLVKLSQFGQDPFQVV